MNARFCSRVLLVGLAFALPFNAFANAGTPLMWASMLHLVFGNAIIGVFEGLVIAFFFKCSKLLCVVVMAAANYFSAWVGGFVLGDWIANQFTWGIYTAWRYFWIMALLTFIITLVFEWPFVALCFFKKPNWLKRSLYALLLTQTLSYLCLFGWYWGASGKSLYTRMEIVQPSKIPMPESVNLYYIAAEDGRIHCRNLGSGIDAIIGEQISTNLQDRLLYWPHIDGAADNYLCLRRDAQRNEDVVFDPVVDIDGNLISRAKTLSEQSNEETGRETWFNFGSAVEFENTSNSDWEFFTGFWPVEGLTAKNNKTAEELRFAWETPYSRWYIRNAIVIPRNLVLFQLGDDQICMLDPNTRQIARLVKGRGPAAEIEPSDQNEF